MGRGGVRFGTNTLSMIFWVRKGGKEGREGGVGGYLFMVYYGGICLLLLL